MKYFVGTAHDLGNVSALSATRFSDLRSILEKPHALRFTRTQFHLLSPKDRSAAKRVGYLTPSAFSATPSARNTASATRCHLLALDIDDPVEAKRLLAQGWRALDGFGFCVWHTASSTRDKPRLRVLVSADDLAPQRYVAAVKSVAELLGLVELTHESLVPVQPMFLPTIFSGELNSPIIASNWDGDPFGPAEIIEPVESTFAPDPGDAPGEVADLSYLQHPMEGIQLADAEAALAFLDPDCPMQEWIELAAALKHQFQDAPTEAFALWDRWSAKGKKYVDAEETAYRWSTLKAQPVDRAPVTMRSLIRKATARGWTNAALAERNYSTTLAWLSDKSRSTEMLYDEGLKRIATINPMLRPIERSALVNSLHATLKQRDMPLSLSDLKRSLRQLELTEARTTGIPPWARNVCYVTALNVFYRPVSNRRFSPEVLDTMHSAPVIGEEPMRPREYLTKIVGVPQVENLLYAPGRERYFTQDGNPFVNTYRPCGLKADKEREDEATHLFTVHLANLIAEPDYRRSLMDFLAYIVQHPGKKIRWAPLIQSTKGAGKTFIAVAMKAVLGRRNVSKVDPAIVMDSKHNDWAYGTQLAVMEEVRIVGHNRHAVMDRLKPCITDDEFCIRRMYDPPQTVDNIQNYLMFTNYHDSLAIQDDERRYFVLASPLQRPEQVKALGGAKYFDSLFRMVRENAAGLLSFFESWPISPEFNPEGRAPVTTYMTELAAISASPLTNAVRTVISDEPHALVKHDLLSMKTLRGYLQSENVGAFSDQALAGVLREAGWMKAGRFSIAGDKHQLWSMGEMPNARSVAESRIEATEVVG